jgi:hypothetical protein
LREFLDREGRESKCSRSSLIEKVLRDFLAVKEGGVSPTEAGGARKTSAWPVKRGDDGEEMKILMLGGVRIALPKDLPVKISFDEGAAAFQIELVTGEKIEVGVPRPGSREL